MAGRRAMGGNTLFNLISVDSKSDNNDFKALPFYLND